MKKLLALTIITALTITASACDGEKPTKVNSMQARDKALSCDDIRLEINESEFYRTEAEKSRGLGVKTVIAPLGYMNTYMNAGDAVDAADARISYLNRIYEIRKCDSQIGKQQQPQVYQAQQAYTGQPQVQYVQPPVQQYGAPGTVQTPPGY
jgi:hypothetical protein